MVYDRLERSLFVEDGDAFEDTFGSELENVQIIIPAGDRIVL